MAEQNKPKRQQFNIISGDSTRGHGGFGTGLISLENLSPVIVDPEANEAYVDMGALHARSSVERRIKFTPNREEVPNGRLYWVVWVAIERKEDGPYYAGVTACEMTVDVNTRRGYKNLAEHVNNMDKALKGHIIVDHMDDRSKQLLADFLKNHDEGMWNRSSEELKNGLQSN